MNNKEKHFSAVFYCLTGYASRRSECKKTEQSIALSFFIIFSLKNRFSLFTGLPASFASAAASTCLFLTDPPDSNDHSSYHSGQNQYVPDIHSFILSQVPVLFRSDERSGPPPRRSRIAKALRKKPISRPSPDGWRRSLQHTAYRAG